MVHQSSTSNVSAKHFPSLLSPFSHHFRLFQGVNPLEFTETLPNHHFSLKERRITTQMTDKRPRTSTMNKTDLMLLEKQLAYKLVKDSQRPSTGSFSVRSPTKNSFSQGSRDNNNSFSLPNINSPSPSSSSSQSPHKLSTIIDQELVNTLSTKPVSLRRKVLTKLMKKKKNPAFDR